MAAVAIAAGIPSVSAAQAASRSAVVARPGDAVRLRTAQWEYTGRLLHTTGDSAFVLLQTDTARVAMPDVVRVQVQRGTQRSPGRILGFAVGGAAAGFFAGALLGAATGEQVSDDEYAGIGGAIVGVTLGTIAGAVGGGIWGARKRYPLWVAGVLSP